jgi:hypothetical protein
VANTPLASWLLSAGFTWMEDELRLKSVVGSNLLHERHPGIRRRSRARVHRARHPGTGAMAILRSFSLALFTVLLLLAPSHAATPGEYQVKAVFLFNFSRFVEWPETAFADSKSPFVVGVFGFDPFGADLDEAVRGESVRGHPLVVRRVRDAADAANCQILFIHHSERNRLPEVLSAVDKRSILTVSDMPDAAKQGVMIRFVTQDGRIRMRINAESARAAHLTISSNLLRSAEIVGSAAREGP